MALSSLCHNVFRRSCVVCSGITWSGVLSPFFTFFVAIFIFVFTFSIELLHGLTDSIVLFLTFAFFSGFFVSGLVFELLGFWASVHEKINNDIPLSVTWEFTSELKGLSGEEPEHVGDGVA